MAASHIGHGLLMRSLSFFVDAGHIHCGTLCGGAGHPQDGSQLCVEGGFAMTLSAKPRAETTMAVLITGNMLRTELPFTRTAPCLNFP